MTTVKQHKVSFKNEPLKRSKSSKYDKLKIQTSPTDEKQKATTTNKRSPLARGPLSNKSVKSFGCKFSKPSNHMVYKSTK